MLPAPKRSSRALSPSPSDRCGSAGSAIAEVRPSSGPAGLCSGLQAATLRSGDADPTVHCRALAGDAMQPFSLPHSMPSYGAFALATVCWPRHVPAPPTDCCLGTAAAVSVLSLGAGRALCAAAAESCRSQRSTAAACCGCGGVKSIRLLRPPCCTACGWRHGCSSGASLLPHL